MTYRVIYDIIYYIRAPSMKYDFEIEIGRNNFE